MAQAPGPQSIRSRLGARAMASAPTNLFIGDLPPDVDDDFLHAVFGPYGAISSVKPIPAKFPGGKGAALVRFESAEEAAWVQENLNGNMPEGMDTPVVISFARSGGGGQSGAPAGGKSWAAPAWGKSAPSKGDKGEGRYSPYAPNGEGGRGKGPGAGWKGGFGKGARGGSFRSMLKGLMKGGALPGVGTRPDEQCVYVKGLPPDTTDLNLYELFAPFGAIAPTGVKAMLKEDGTCNSVGFVDFQDPSSAAAAVEALNGTELPDGTTLHLNLKRPKKGGGKGFAS
mmetsp:Transcript_28033/g.80538  ORF Transcript_28033/g.80538 Transcript_28033/m.80538 type:complete len:284 (-) Transcript_28033:48-899(-)